MEQAPGKTGQNPGFSIKSKEAVPKTEVLEQPQLSNSFFKMSREKKNLSGHRRLVFDRYNFFELTGIFKKD
ncbi:MAG: hypothetical protein LBB78_07030 [Spirochaetaceae bacterium]|jgi:hypothetical protein|nr:hypothetical protein [Spirochaetaceae bacterium]